MAQFNLSTDQATVLIAHVLLSMLSPNAAGWSRDIRHAA